MCRQHTKRLYKRGWHGHMLSHVCMLAARDTQLIPCCSNPMLSRVAREHMESPGDLRLCMALCVFHMCMAAYEPMLACCPLASQVFPWPLGHMHSRYRMGTVVLPAWIREGMVRHGPGTHGSIQTQGHMTGSCAKPHRQSEGYSSGRDSCALATLA